MINPRREASSCSCISQALFPTIAFPQNICAAEIESPFFLLWYTEMCLLPACMYGPCQHANGLCLIHFYLTCTLSALFSLLPLKCFCEPGWAWMEGWDEGKRDSKGQREMQGEGLKCSRCFYIMAWALVHSISCPGKPDITHTYVRALHL